MRLKQVPTQVQSRATSATYAQDHFYDIFSPSHQYVTNDAEDENVHVVMTILVSYIYCAMVGIKLTIVNDIAIRHCGTRPSSAFAMRESETSCMSISYGTSSTRLSK